MPAKVTTVKSPKPGQGATIDVPDEVKNDIETIYETLRQNPDEEGFVEFDNADEVNKWMSQVRSYCRHRQAGALKFRQLPSKHLPDTQIRFSLAADLPANGERGQSETDKTK
jgi:hypothetical protein